jgi:hypothetical protein
MGLEVAVGSSPSTVRAGALAKDVAWASAKHPVFAVISPVAPARLWSQVAETVRVTLEESLGDGQKGLSALERAVGAGAQSLGRLRSVLIEPHLSLDAQLVSMVIVGDQAHIAISAGMRVYRARNGEPQRLLNHAHRSPGITHGGMLVTTERLSRGDLFVFGSRDGFGMRSIGAMAAVLAQRPDASARDLCEAVLRPCRASGVSTGMVVLRVR